MTIKEPRALTTEEYSHIQQIALKAAKNLDYTTCYTITLLYYLMQFSGLNENQIPPKYFKPVKLLYKNPASSYIHYSTEIMYSNNKYARAIKNAEIELNGGDDPRCPW